MISRERARGALPEISLLRLWTAPLRLVPDWLIIGAARCGTSSLYQYLMAHPSFARPLRKEIHYFDLGFDKGPEWYRAHFPLKWRALRAKRARAVTGEASPYYLFHPLVPARVARSLPHVRLVALLRNPVDRAYSHYHHSLRIGSENASFEEGVRSEATRLDGEEGRIVSEGRYQSFSHRHHSYLARGRYAHQLRRWLAVFPREQLLVLASEQLFADPVGSLGRVLEFLDVEPKWPMRGGAYGRGEYAAMDAGLRRELVQHFRPHNRALYELLGTTFDWDR